MLTHIVAKTLIFNSHGQVLLLVRSADDPHRPDGYDLPGGKVDDGEAMAVGAAREADEEAGLTLTASDLQLVYAKSWTGYQNEVGADINFVWFGYVAKLPDTTRIQLSHEHQAYEWATMDEAIVKSEGATQQLFMRHLKDNGIATELWHDHG